MLSFVLFCVSFIVACNAQVPHLGGCPDVSVVQNLDVNRYLGDWYEIQKFPFFIEGVETCIRANYSIKPENGHIKVFNRGISRNGAEENAVGDAYPPDSSVPAKLVVSFNSSPHVPYWIVDTDYDNYSLVWSCTDLGGIIQADFAWILSRKKTLDAATVQKLEDKLKEFSINTDSFRTTVQENCPY